MTVTTCLPEDVPKGTKLTFEASGNLAGTGVVAAQRGTTVSVDKLFHNLPVRRRELERNIKREWQKVISLLNQYACIRTNTKFSVSQQPTKGKRVVLFSTNNNPTTRENLVNIFGAKTMTALVPLDLRLEMEPSTSGSALQQTLDPTSISREVKIVGYVSRPTHGDGRQTPDRQMFFINGRPCGLPQFSKTFNEVYKSYNSTQSPFIFADIQLDTHMYDVNVSPDKRTILLHNQHQLLDSIRTSLIDVFDSHEYTVPASQLTRTKQRAFNRGATFTPSRPEASNRQSNATPGLDTTSSSDGDEHGYEENTSTRRPNPVNIATPDLKPGSRQADHLIDHWVQRKADPENMNERENMLSEEESEPREPTLSQHNKTNAAAERKEPPASSETDADGADGADGGDGAQLDPGEITRTDGESSSDRRMRESRNNAQIAGHIRHDDVSNASPLSIPTIQHRRGADWGVHHLTRRSPVKRAAEQAQIVIGDPAAPAGRSKRRKLSEASESVDDSADTDLSNGESPPRKRRQSFGTNLSQKFAAVQSKTTLVPSRQKTTNRDYSASSEDDDTEAEHRFDEETIEALAGDAAEASPRERDEPPDSRFSADLQDSEDASETDHAPRRASHPNDVRAKIDTTEGQAKARAQSLQINARRKDTTLDLVQEIAADEARILTSMGAWRDRLGYRGASDSSQPSVEDITAADAESKLSLIISKSDFGKLRVAGQFNLGFIIAIRPGKREKGGPTSSDELFIIDQHASDEKYNFERLQDTTVVQSQRLVHAKTLELTALEEEIVMQSTDAIEANGFKIDIDTDGDYPVGSRCQLTSLPLSRETIFDVRDLEELISLLGDQSSESKHIPRPSKVRKMFAMRACRSSIMIGKALTRSQMYNVLGHMGELDKPWNCPHGRPTMRHLCGFQGWDEKGWAGDGYSTPATPWAAYERGE